MSDRRIARSAGLAGTATLASRVLGLVRDQVLAAVFGAGNQMDAFVVAFRIPNLVRDLFAEGALSSAFVPTFTSHLARRGRADAWRLGQNVLTALAIVTGLLVLAGWLFAHPLVTAMAGEYAAVPGKIELTILLTRVMLPFLTLAAIAAALMGMLNSLHHYFVPALAPATFNVVVIAGAVFLVPVMPALGLPGVAAIALAVLAGGLAQVLIQWPLLRHEGFTYRPRLDPADAGLRRVLVLMGPGAVGLAATQVNLFVNTLLATGLGTGAVSWLAYAFRLMYLPIGLFGVSIATAILPIAARHADRADLASVRDTVARGLGLMLLLNVPATVGLIALADPIVRLLFERGQFVAADTAATAVAVRMYAIGLLGYAAARIASPVFYTLGEGRTPIAISAGAMAVNVVVSILLVRTIGFPGLALGTSVAALAHGGAALLILRRRLSGLGGRRLPGTFFRITLASLAMAAAALAGEQWAATAMPGEEVLPQAGRLFVAMAAGVLTLAVCARLAGVAELDEIVSAARQKLKTRLAR